jgi:hypothetical protein
MAFTISQLVEPLVAGSSEVVVERGWDVLPRRRRPFPAFEFVPYLPHESQDLLNPPTVLYSPILVLKKAILDVYPIRHLRFSTNDRVVIDLRHFGLRLPILSMPVIDVRIILLQEWLEQRV